MSGGIYTHYLGTGLNDGAWHYVEIEVDDLISSISGGAHTVSRVEGVAYGGKDIYVDDIMGEIPGSFCAALAGVVMIPDP